MKKETINGLFAVGVIAALLAAMALAVVHPKAVNFYENRPASALPAFSGADVLSGTYQDGLEAALHDQLPAAQGLEEQYQSAVNALVFRAIKAQSEKRPDVYYAFRDLMLYHGDIVYAPVEAETLSGEIFQKSENLNAVFDSHPELRYYVYYIEKDTDINFETGTPMGVSDEMLYWIWLPDDCLGVYPVRSFADFRENFFRTDHHWNHVGSYRAYLALLDLLGKKDPVQPEGTVRITDDFCGSKAVTSGAGEFFSEPFDVYRFSFPDMTITINGKCAADYGRQNQPWDEAAYGPVSYSGWYGDDNGEVIFRTGNTGAGRLLVLGESYDNAILKLLASHYETLCAVDLRSFEADTGRPFRFSDYVETHEIDTVLFIGNIDYFRLDAFHVEV